MPIKFISVILLLVLFTACDECKDPADWEAQELEVKVRRYEQDLFAVSEHDSTSMMNLDRSYPGFHRFYLQDLMSLDVFGDSGRVNPQAFEPFKNDASVNELLDSIQSKFTDLSDVEHDLEVAFKHIRYYYPKAHLPQVVSTLSGLQYAGLTLDSSWISIGLDLYLGKDFRPYGNFFPQYVVERFEPEYILPNSMKVMYGLLEPMDEDLDRKELLYEMVENGKQLYWVEQMMPCSPKHLVIGYSPEQLAWCEHFEYNVWTFFLEKELLYSDEFMDYKRFLEDGPKTNGLPPESPGNIGSWIGWRIVNKFMEEADGKLSLQELIDMDPRAIVSKARYKPRKPLL